MHIKRIDEFQILFLRSLKYDGAVAHFDIRKLPFVVKVYHCWHFSLEINPAFYNWLIDIFRLIVGVESLFRLFPKIMKFPIHG